MKLRLVSHLLPALLAAMNLCSCAATRFYSEVDGGGVIVGRPCIDWMKPDKFVYDKRKNASFAFRRFNGEIIRPDSIETDGGSIPRLLWFQDGFSPWTYAPAYLIHDWLYEAHRRKQPAGIGPDGKPLFYTREQADWIMAEVIKTQMERSKDFDTKKSMGQLRKIYWAVSKFGDEAWNGHATPVRESDATLALTEALQKLPFAPVVGSVKAQLTTVPDKPDQQGSRTHRP